MSDGDSRGSVPNPPHVAPGGYADFGLTPPGIEAFHQALKAALAAGFALDLGGTHAKPTSMPAPFGRLTLDKLETLEELVKSLPPNWPEQPDLTTQLPQKYVAGFSVYLTTERTDLVLNAMSVDCRNDRELARVARPALAYLAILTLIGAIGSGILAVLLLSFDDMREDLQRTPRSMAITGDESPWITQSQISLLPWVLLAMIAIVLACLLPRASAAIAKCFGGFGYQHSQRRAAAVWVEYALIQSGASDGNAEKMAIQLVGPQPMRHPSSRTLSRTDQSQSDLQRLAFEAKHHLARSNTRLRHLRLGLPLFLIVIVGSAGVLIYSLVLFIPLTNLLNDLSAPIVDPVTGLGQK